MHKFFATCPRQLENLLAQELQSLGAVKIKEFPAGVEFFSDMAGAYRVLLQSRLANQILQPIAEFSDISTWDDYYRVLFGVEWTSIFALNKTFAVEAVSIRSPLDHRLYGLQRAKDAIADVFRKKFGERPSVQVERPDVAIHILIRENTVVASLNLSGESLHRRGYRLQQGEAPLKENLAAAVLMRAGWPQAAEEGKPFVDPMCGSGTLLIEAALMAGKIAPGLFRDYYAAKGLSSFDSGLWQKIKKETEEQRREILSSFRGYDADGRVLATARANIARAGLQDTIEVAQQPLAAPVSTSHEKPGLLCVNPPYGERLGQYAALEKTYQQLGAMAKTYYSGWQLSVFTGNPPLARNMKLSPTKVYKFFNGSIPCELWNCGVGTYKK